MDFDYHYMRLALKQAARGFGKTSPNPRVGALIVKDGQVLCRGFHRAFGALHAEADCLSKLSAGQAGGATFYVNLEPCCYFGKTPPCTDAIIQSGIRRLVFGMTDPNPLVNGNGIAELKKAGIEVTGPILETESREINRGYLKFRETGKPWVTLKIAQSLDGRIATANGDSRWISGDDSLKFAHRLRAEHDAILIGINTVLADDPQLNVRLVKGRNPIRVILDSDLKINPNAKVFQTDHQPVLIATKPYPPADKMERLQEQGAEFTWLPPDEKGNLDLAVLLDHLGQRGILYLLVEGGGTLISSFIQRKLFNELIMVTAPIVIGGDGIPSIAPMGVQKLAESVKVSSKKQRKFGDDFVNWLRPI